MKGPDGGERARGRRRSDIGPLGPAGTCPASVPAAGPPFRGGSGRSAAAYCGQNRAYPGGLSPSPGKNRQKAAIKTFFLRLPSTSPTRKGDMLALMEINSIYCPPVILVQKRKDVSDVGNRSKNGQNIDKTSAGCRWCRWGDILPNPDQPPAGVAHDKLLELAQSIDENGLLESRDHHSAGRQTGAGGGERRLRAAKIAGLQGRSPVWWWKRTGERSALIALVENLQREERNVFEQAEGIQRLIQVYGLTQEEASNRLGCAQSTVANKLRLLRLSGEQRSRITEAGLSSGTPVPLLRLEDEELRDLALTNMIAAKMTVAQADRLVEELLSGKVRRRRPPAGAGCPPVPQHGQPRGGHHAPFRHPG